MRIDSRYVVKRRCGEDEQVCERVCLGYNEGKETLA